MTQTEITEATEATETTTEEEALGKSSRNFWNSVAKTLSLTFMAIGSITVGLLIGSFIDESDEIVVQNTPSETERMMFAQALDEFEREFNHKHPMPVQDNPDAPYVDGTVYFDGGPDLGVTYIQFDVCSIPIGQDMAPTDDPAWLRLQRSIDLVSARHDNAIYLYNISYDSGMSGQFDYGAGAATFTNHTGGAVIYVEATLNAGAELDADEVEALTLEMRDAAYIEAPCQGYPIPSYQQK